MVSFIPGFSLISEEKKFRYLFTFCISADIVHSFASSMGLFSFVT